MESLSQWLRRKNFTANFQGVAHFEFAFQERELVLGKGDAGSVVSGLRALEPYFHVLGIEIGDFRFARLDAAEGGDVGGLGVGRGDSGVGRLDGEGCE